MPATFLGKWRIFEPKPDVRHFASEGYAAYEPAGGDQNPDNGFCVWYVYWPDRGPYPPGKETNIAFLLRSDGQLCFLMNSGQYIGYDGGIYPFVNALDEATGFAFPGHDIRNLPTSFTGALQSTKSNKFLGDLWGMFIDGLDEPRWDNDSENPQNFSTGYVKFVVKLNGSVLDMHGTAVRIERLGDNKQLQMDTETCNLTAVAVTNMNSQMICPNGTALGMNQQAGERWDQLWLRAATPPKPPACVPSDYNWCPPSSVAMGKKRDGKL